MPSLTDALALTPEDDTLVGAVPSSWGQGRAAFGGLVAAFGLRAMERNLGAVAMARSVLVDFLAPVEPGRVTVDARALRAGRAITHAEARVRQGEEVRAVVLATFADARATAIEVPAARAPAAPAPEFLPALPYLEGVTPAFTRHFEYRWTTGGLPFTGSDTPVLGGWVRLAAPTRPDHAAVLALADAWPAPVLPLLTTVAPASTVTWMVDFVRPVPAAAPDEWWRYEADTVAASGGYASVHARLWAPDGGLVAVSRQLVAEFSR